MHLLTLRLTSALLTLARLRLLVLSGLTTLVRVLSLLLHPSELGGELLDLVLLLVDFGTELVMNLLELARQPGAVHAPLATALGALAALSWLAIRGLGGARSARHRIPGAELGQRHRHVDSHEIGRAHV